MRAFIVAPVKEKYPVKKDVWVMPLAEAIKEVIYGQIRPTTGPIASIRIG
jgi:hypothetical protein